MKKTHIVIIMAIVVALGTIIVLFSSSDTYSDFTKAGANPLREHQIIGKLDTLRPVVYDPKKNANEFSFYMSDEKGRECKVLYKGTKPQDFEKSEQVVITGKMENDSVFAASDMLLKCPSKYNEDKKPEQFGNREFNSGKKSAK
jgi:cytochrome c-type biogenesis protein CcmE